MIFWTILMKNWYEKRNEIAHENFEKEWQKKFFFDVFL